LSLASSTMKNYYRSASLSSSHMQKKALKALGTRPMEHAPNRNIVNEEANEEERDDNERPPLGLHNSPPPDSADTRPLADEWNQQVEVTTAPTTATIKEEPTLPKIRTAPPSLATGRTSSSLGQLHEFAPRIVVAGVGGGGSNAVNHMIAEGLQGMWSGTWILCLCVDTVTHCQSPCRQLRIVGQYLTPCLRFGLKSYL
jgi:hypothetical protein